jgi:hypothetical protein
MCQNIQYWNLHILNTHVCLPMGHSSSARVPSAEKKVVLCRYCWKWGFSMEEKVFIFEYYFYLYRSGRQGGSSLKTVAEQFWVRFNKTASSNTVMLSTVTQFRHTGSLLCQQKGKFDWPVTVSAKENHAHVPQQVLHLPWPSLWWMALKLNVSNTSACQLFKDLGSE